MAACAGRGCGTAWVIVQIAASLVLLLEAGLLLRGLQRARALDLGFRPAGVVYGEYDLRALGYAAARAQAFNDAIADRARQTPGITSVAFASHVPLHGGVRRVTVRLLDAPTVSPVTTIVSIVSPAYFETLGIPIVAGRGFPLAAGPVVVISEGLARRFWPGQPAVGRVLAAPGWAVPRAVVGVVRDASNAAIWRDKEMSIYLPIEASTDARDVRLIVRAAGDPTAASRALKMYAASLDGDLRFQAIPLDSLLRTWMLPSLVAAGGAATLAAIALILACIGIYGMLAFTVSQRMREIGVRMALGADARNVMSLVLRDGCRMVGKGLLAGGACSLVTAPLLGRLLFDVSAYDPLTMIGVPVLLAAVALGACYLPARRAARLQPLAVLRVD